MNINNWLPIDEIFNNLSDENLIKLLSKNSAIVRGRAIATLGYRIENSKVRQQLLDCVKNPENSQLDFFNSIKISWIAALAIIEHGDIYSKEELAEIINSTWSFQQREYFGFYIKNHKGFSILSSGEAISIED